MASLHTIPADDIVGITSNATTHNLCRGIRIGVAGNYDFYVDTGTWREVQNCQAGELIPLRATGARDSSDDSAPAAGEIYFLY